MKIVPARRIRGSIRLPGDKSISHRAALIAAAAHGRSRLSNFSSSADCASTVSCLRALGVDIRRDGDAVTVTGVDAHFSAAPVSLDCKNSGSTMRMIAGLLAGQQFTSVLAGDRSLNARPMQRIIGPLERMGARISSENGRPPLLIEGRQPLVPIRYEAQVASAQVKTCILLAGLLANGRTQFIEHTATRDHTERLMRWFGIPLTTSQFVDNFETTHTIDGPVRFGGREVRIPGDFSSAAFLLAAAALLSGSDLRLEQVGLNPTRTQFMKTLRSFGAGIETDERDDCDEVVGNLRVRGRENLSANSSEKNYVDGSVAVGLIDELPLLAVVGTQLAGGLAIRGATELRAKESDRIAATVENLRAMGADVEEYEDGLAVSGPVRLRGAMIDSHEDHRIAMAFTIAALIASGESIILGSDCVDVSFPGFFETLESIVER